jgi:hypothetical protein
LHGFFARCESIRARFLPTPKRTAKKAEKKRGKKRASKRVETAAERRQNGRRKRKADVTTYIEQRPARVREKIVKLSGEVRR